MPRFATSVEVDRPLEEVFDFFRRPANLVRVSPPDLHLRLVEGPELLALGSRLVVQARRFGVPQRIVTVVTAYEPNALFVDEQREGPFRKWVQTHRFEALPAGTRISDQIDFEPPGGVVGLLVTARVIEKELQAVFAYRSEQLRAIFK